MISREKALEREAIVYQQTIKGILYDKNTAENDRDVLMAKLESARRTNDELVEALEKLESWANAYPLEVFPEPNFGEVAELLKASGHSIDTVSASNMRHVIKQTKEIVSDALAKAKER